MTTPATIKRRDPQRSRANILAAAQALFAERGYAQTGLREIASLAGVSSTLLVKYYESKAGLFEAALSNALELEFITSEDRSRFGENLVSAVLDTRRPITIPAMLTLSIGDAEAAAISARFARQHIIKPVAKWLGPPRASARAYTILMLSTGFIIYNRHILIEESSPARASVANWLAHTAQAIVDGDESALEAYQPASRR
ncbi:TetR/AcrR family transcriptional regulator [Mangrovimicrobium sediminis]|uniref:TetR/AcrR family transcriptional regulator n=1 Tax=Mangrovimicrobium sediminis TaxID=2562682 RepID=A0A4Z0LXB5_9GAMM|nr:TetR/AcrR family transcriptional regulator [Haliea sp. SAOS-164]TGD71806.1 TetR/AcrR family transcriptional regulator [Haliea sp. SAOS-164]